MSMVMWGWWEGTLTHDQRTTLMDFYDRPLDPDFARVLWLQPVALSIVESNQRHPTGAPIEWRLTTDVREFVAARDYERRHPDQE